MKEPLGKSCEGHRQRLRERFLKSGFAGMADYEIVELLLTLAIPRSDVKPQAKALIARFGNLRAILDAAPRELASVKGIGTVAPVALRIIREASNLYLQQREEERSYLANPEELASFWRLRLGSLHNEVFEIALLNARLELLPDGVERLEEGTVDRASVYPRRVIETALRRSAAAVVLAHNHTNGDSNPSDFDRTLTRAIVLAAETVQIRIVDHLIVSREKVFSFRSAGLI